MIGDPEFETRLWRTVTVFLAVLGVFWLALIVALLIVALEY